MSAPISPGTGSSCCSTARTNTAVLPMPDLAWQMTSMPRIACGMHSCWTSDGCSKPQSTKASCVNFLLSTITALLIGSLSIQYSFLNFSSMHLPWCEKRELLPSPSSKTFTRSLGPRRGSYLRSQMPQKTTGVRLPPSMAINLAMWSSSTFRAASLAIRRSSAACRALSMEDMAGGLEFFASHACQHELQNQLFPSPLLTSGVIFLQAWQDCFASAEAFGLEVLPLA
mmetsp:Transcript_97664/g.237500  ORF Transcript_97664/g.237500 Transcript_97664/m.237500 type:complete len:227 (-) Transcript_97664:269-949(-)